MDKVVGLRTELKEFEEDMQKAQNGKIEEYLSVTGDNARFKRIKDGYSLSKNFGKLSNFQLGFLNYYLTLLNLRARTVADENVLAIINSPEENLQAAVIPFRALRCLRGGEDRRSFEYMADGTMRQYIAFHTYPANFYGLAITEAENKPMITQGDHNHGGFEEETIFLSNNVVIVSGKLESFAKGQSFSFGGRDFKIINIDKKKVKIKFSDGTIKWVEKGKVITRDAQGNFVIQDGIRMDRGDVVSYIYISNIDNDSIKIFYPDLNTQQIFNFGDMSLAPVIDGQGVQHQLSNPNEYSSVDFTLKNPLGQLMKGSANVTGEIGLTNPEVERKEWGEIYRQRYEKNGGEIFTGIDQENGNIILHSVGSAWQVKEINPVQLEAQIAVVKPEKSTEKFAFSPIDGEVQVLRIFPWPKNIEGEQWLREDNQILDEDIVEITLYGDQGEMTFKAKLGDVIVLKNQGNHIYVEGNKFLISIGGIRGYSIKNLSKGYEVMFLTFKEAEDR